MESSLALSRRVPRRQGSRIALAVASGLLFAASFAPLGAWLLAFVVLAPLVVALDGVPSRRGALLGWIAGTVGSLLATGPWITAASERYFTTGRAGAIVFAFGVGQLFHAWAVTVFGALAPHLLRTRSVLVRVLGIAAAWTACEFARSTWLTGAPWNLLAHAVHARPLLVQTADFGGVYAVSFVVAGIGAALGVAWADARVAWRALATGGVVLAAALLYGGVRLAAEDDGAPTLRVALVQGNVPNGWREQTAHAADAFEAFAAATRPVLPERPALVVWSENALSFVLAPNERFREAIAALLGPDGPLLLLGGPRFAQRGPGRVDFFNSAHLLDASAVPIAVYDKRRLVPFAEYAPVDGVPGLGWRFETPGAYTPGTRPVVFTRPAPFGVLICYEAIYPNLARDLARAGAEFLVNISNDAWFGTSAGLEQHFAASVFRAIETRRALARGTNTGITALVAPSGRVVARFPTGQRAAWVVDVPLRGDVTPYTRLGDLFAWASVGVTLLLVAARRVRQATVPTKTRAHAASPREQVRHIT
jgi:apolipoprotein N-acyltransferase